MGLPERQRILRATVEWSIGLLEDAERSLLEVTAIFAGGWTVPAASAVAGLGEDRALELCEALAGHSLVYLDSTQLGPRSRMLETIREFVAEWLAARPDADQIERRHAGYYRALAEQADRPLRRSGQGEWLERLDAEAGNLDMAVGRYDDALQHVCEARDLAERSGGDWLTAGPRVQLGILDVLRGRTDEARTLLGEALDRSLAARSTPFVTLCLVA